MLQNVDHWTHSLEQIIFVFAFQSRMTRTKAKTPFRVLLPLLCIQRRALDSLRLLFRAKLQIYKYFIRVWNIS